MHEFNIMYSQYGSNQNLKQGLLLNLVVLIALKVQTWWVMVSKIVFNHYFWPTKIFIFQYHEENSKLAIQKSFDVNPCTKLWKKNSSSQIFVEKNSWVQ